MLEAKQLTKYYGPHLALDGLDLTIAPGEIFCLLGGNGAGKTTIIHLFMGFVRPSAGAAFVNGLEVHTRLDQVRRRVAYVPESVSLYPALTGYENLAFFSQLSGLDTCAPLEKWLDRVGLDQRARAQRVAGYSKGMRQKVGLAIALAKGARVLLLDEPLSGLDPEASNQLCGLLGGVAREGVSVLMATHDLFRAKRVADRMGIMSSGRLVTTLNTDAVALETLERAYFDHAGAARRAEITCGG